MHLQQTKINDQESMLKQLSVRRALFFGDDEEEDASKLTLVFARLQTILQRQQIIGQAIGQEISEQNELLDKLDEEVDRTGAKMGKAKRQMVSLRVAFCSLVRWTDPSSSSDRSFRTDSTKPRFFKPPTSFAQNYDSKQWVDFATSWFVLLLVVADSAPLVLSAPDSHTPSLPYNFSLHRNELS